MKVAPLTENFNFAHRRLGAFQFLNEEELPPVTIAFVIFLILVVPAL